MQFRDYRIPRLEDDEVRELARDARRGDATARERLILLGAGLVHHRGALRRYRRLSRWLPLEDAMQEGWVAMVRAADGYDPDRIMPFRRYAWLTLCNHTAHLLEQVRAKKRRARLADRCEGADGYDPIERLADRCPWPWHHADARLDAATLLGRAGGRDAVVLAMHFGLDGHGARSMDEVGASLGISRRRADQLRQRAMAAIRGT